MDLEKNIRKFTHDISTPVTTLQLQLEALSEEIKRGNLDQQSLLKKSEQGLSSIQQVINKIIEFRAQLSSKATS